MVCIKMEYVLYLVFENMVFSIGRSGVVDLSPFFSQSALGVSTSPCREVGAVTRVPENEQNATECFKYYMIIIYFK